MSLVGGFDHHLVGQFDMVAMTTASRGQRFVNAGQFYIVSYIGNGKGDVLRRSMAVGPNQRYHFGVGLVYFSGWIGMFTGGTNS